MKLSKNLPGTSGMKRKRKAEVNNELDAKMIKFNDHQINFPNNDHNNRHFLKIFCLSCHHLMMTRPWNFKQAL